MIPRTRSARWLYAAKPQSWPKLLVPCAMGQALGIASAEPGSLGVTMVAIVFGLAFTVAGTLFIVWTNDWADRDVDRIKRRLFPDQCSPKTIPDGILPSHHVLLGGVVAGVVALASSVVAAIVLDRTGVAIVGGVSMMLFVAYSLPPLRLNYRGGGELVEAVGAGIALPGYNAYLHAGAFPDLGLLGGFAALCLASAVASGLSDEVSDRAGGKRTVAVVLGNRAARAIVEASVALAGAWWLVVMWGADGILMKLGYAAAVVVIGVALVALRRQSDRACTNAFGEQAVYKLVLHRGSWVAGLLIALVELGFG